MTINLIYGKFDSHILKQKSVVVDIYPAINFYKRNQCKRCNKFTLSLVVESLCLHVMVTGLKPMECILFVVFFFFCFFKGPAHILLNIIKAKPNPVHIRALRVQPIPYGFA